MLLKIINNHEFSFDMATRASSIKTLVSLTNVMFLINLNITVFYKWPFYYMAINEKNTINTWQ